MINTLLEGRKEITKKIDIMKLRLSLLTALLLALALPQNVKAYDFSAVCSTGQMLYYNYISGSSVTVTYPGNSWDYLYSGYTKPTGSLEIPSSVTYNGTTYSVTKIGIYAFYYCSGLTSVTIPNTVTSIGGGTFYGCSGLTTVTIPTSVTSIGDYAFQGCGGLTSVTIPTSVTSIGEGAFVSCSGLTSITVESGNTVYDSHGNCNAIIKTTTNTLIAGCMNTVIPNSVTSIGNYAFRECGGLTSVTIPNSVTSIGSHAFWSCTGLTSVTIGSSVTSIGNDAFGYCNRLTSVTIPNSVTSIGDFAFYYCSGLATISLGSSVYSIGEKAFAECYLPKITSWNEVPPLLGEGCFNGFNMNIPVYVPCDAMSAYQAASGWNEFTNYQCPPVGIRGLAGEECEISIYQRDGRIVVESGDGMPLGDVWVYDAVGRMLATRQSDIQTVTFDIPALGAYLVKVGSAPARKVVVIR